MNKNNEYVNMEKYQEMLENIKTKEFTGDYSWLKHSGKAYKKKLEEEIKRLSMDQALSEFEKENGYDFIDVINNEEIRKNHQLTQEQKKEYDDNDFLHEHQDKQKW